MSASANGRSVGQVECKRQDVVWKCMVTLPFAVVAGGHARGGGLKIICNSMRQY